MENVHKDWLTTKNIQERWHVCDKTVRDRMKAAREAGVPAEPIRVGRVNLWTLDQVRAVENANGWAPLFQ